MPLPSGRQRFPDESVRLIYEPGEKAGAYLANTEGLAIQIFTDQAASHLADIRGWPSQAAIPNSTLQVDGNSQIPIFYGPPDGSTVLYGEVVGTTQVFELLARSEDRLGVLEGAGRTGGITFTQSIPAAVWTIAHGLGYQPGVQVRDDTGTVVTIDIVHQDLNTVIVSCDGGLELAGSAYLL